MQIHARWVEKMQLDTSMDGHTCLMDAKAPIGNGKGPTPKELLLSAVAGCTAMDVLALLRKHKQNVEGFDVLAKADLTKGHPAVFAQIDLEFRVKGPIDPHILTEAIGLSQSQYCGVSAMINKVVPIHWVVIVNGEQVGQGDAHF